MKRTWRGASRPKMAGRWNGRYCSKSCETGIGPLAKQKAGVRLAQDKRVRSTLPVAVFLLDAFNTKTGRCDWSIPNIADELDMSRSSVFRALKTLHECGYLKWIRHAGTGFTNAYCWGWSALLGEAETAQDESEEETNRVQGGVRYDTSPVSDMRLRGVRYDTQIREEKDYKKEKTTTKQKNAQQKKRGNRDIEQTRQSSQLGLRAFSVVYDAATASAGVARIKARERVQKVLSANSLWGAAMENDGAFEAAILAEQNKPGACLQAFNAALEQLVDNSGELAQCL